MSAFLDTYGDTLTIENVADNVYLTIDYKIGGIPQVEFAPDKAEDVATAILVAAGRNVLPIESLKRASDISFNEALLRVACAHDRTVRFRYAKDTGKYIEARTLNPERMTDDGKAVIGFDPDRGEVRRFNLDRIKGEVDFA